MHCSIDSSTNDSSDSPSPGAAGGRALQLLLAGLFAIGALGSTSCAQQREPIDRVQPNAIDKSELTGHEWYYQRTVVDAPASNVFTFVGRTDRSLSRITWDIQEDYLYARRSFEFIEGAANKAEKGEDFEGEVVAAYRIEKHFDITKAYNQTTGEELNIREENSRDRPWYDRTHMRVDWSKNMVTNYDLDFERESIEPVPYYVQNKNPDSDRPHPDAPRFDYANEEDDKNLQYFDITNKIHARAGTTTIEGYGEVPVCFLRGQETTECGAGEYAIRNSFKRIDPDKDYQPKPYKGPATDKFGYFTTERLVYDDKEGIRQQQRKRYLNRFNLWENWTDEQGSLIPPSERELDPIVYHVNRQFPEDLKSVARETADQYNEIFTDAVEAAGKELEDGQRVFILCPNNPVQEGDPEACGEPGTSPRIGDIRYSFMAYVPEYMDYGLLGYGPSNNDPLTGEIISGMSYVYHYNNNLAHDTQEKVELLNGTRDQQEYLDGVDLTNWREEVTEASAAEHGATGNDMSARRQHGLQEADNMVENMTERPSFEQWQGRRNELTERDFRKMRRDGFEDWVSPVLDRIHRQEHQGVSRTPGTSGLARFENTYLEDHLVGKELLIGMGRKPTGSNLSSSQKDLASPVRSGFIDQALQRYKSRQKFARNHNMYLADMVDHGLRGLAREMEDESSEEIYQKIRQTLYTSVMTHEVGHSLGLMHNFGASDDAINYFDDYWKIRDDGTVGPRLEDPVTREELDQKIHNYAYSSTMDYKGKMTIGGQGTGKYDRAAILYGYADKVEVFEDIRGMDPSMLREWHAQDGSVLTFQEGRPASIHYTTFYDEMGPALYKDQNRRLVDVDDLVTDEDGDRDWSTAEVDGETYHRVPYIYCSHSSANLSDHCLTRDYGADSYERMKHMLDDLNTWYITRAFPRGQIGATKQSYVSSIYRTYDRLKKWNDLYGLYAGDLLPRFFDAETTEQFLTDPEEGWGNKTWAVQNAFNYLVQTMLMPKVGTYNGPYPRPGGESMVRSDYGASEDVAVQNERIDVTEGRFYSTSWNAGERECGYFWQECLHHFGFYLDKMMAVYALSDTETNFVARSTPEDIRQWEIGYWTTFPDQISRINEAMMSEQWESIGPYFAENTEESDDDWELRWPNYANLEQMNASRDRPVKPSATFTVKLYWQLLGQLRFPDTYDQSFAEQSRVWVEGTGQEPDVDDDQKMTLTDPNTGMTYGALDLEDRGAGARMMERAIEMKAWTNYCDDSGETSTPDDDCALGLNESLRERFTGDFEDYLELVKVVADVNAVRRYGSPFSP
jgi:hypothetical protein